MKRTFLGAAAAAVLTLSGVAAHAGCADPRTVDRSGAFQVMPALTLQKSMSGNNSNSENAGGNICMGSWKQVGRRQFSRNHIGWSYDNGKLSGYFTETETDEVAFDGNSYSGLNDSKIYDLNNHLLAEVQGTSAATRIAP